MKEYFSSKKAVQYIGEGKVVKMLSSDFKSHFFKKSKNYKTPVLHEIQRNIGKNFYKEMTFDEFKETYKDNEFFVYEEN